MGAQNTAANESARCLAWMRQASAEGRAFWDYHQTYQPVLDALASEGALIKWLDQDLTSAHWGHYYIAALGYWTMEAFTQRALNVLHWLSRHRAEIVANGYGDLERWGDRQHVLESMAGWVCALIDLAETHGEGL